MDIFRFAYIIYPMACTGDSLQFRYATAEDIPALTNVYIESVMNILGIPEAIASTDSFRGSMQNKMAKTMTEEKERRYLAAFKENKMVGFTSYKKTSDKNIHIEEFFALEKTGSALHKEVILKENASTISLYSLLSAEGAYKRWGYIEHSYKPMLLPEQRVQEWRECPHGHYPRYDGNSENLTYPT